MQKKHLNRSHSQFLHWLHVVSKNLGVNLSEILPLIVEDSQAELMRDRIWPQLYSLQCRLPFHHCRWSWLILFRIYHQITISKSLLLWWRGTHQLRRGITLLNALAAFPIWHPHLKCKASFKWQNHISIEISLHIYRSSKGGWQSYLCPCFSMELFPVITAVHIRTWQVFTWRHCM